MTEHEGLNGYKAFWRGKTTEVWAATSYEAYTKAVAFWGVKPRRAYEVHVVLCERADGTTVTHDPAEFG